MATPCNIHHKTVTYCNNLKQTVSQAQESPDTPTRELDPHRGIRGPQGN